MFTLKCNVTDESSYKHTIFDSNGRCLDIYIMTSTKSAGKKAIFYVKNCVIDNT